MMGFKSPPRVGRGDGGMYRCRRTDGPIWGVLGFPRGVLCGMERAAWKVMGRAMGPTIGRADAGR